MLLLKKEQEVSLVTLISLSIAISSLGLFICTQTQATHSLAYMQPILTGIVTFLSTLEISKDNDRLLNGVALLITAIPIVFYILMVILSLIVGNY